MLHSIPELFNICLNAKISSYSGQLRCRSEIHSTASLLFRPLGGYTKYIVLRVMDFSQSVSLATTQGFSHYPALCFLESLLLELPEKHDK